jgi:hypothetical protein
MSTIDIRDNPVVTRIKFNDSQGVYMAGNNLMIEGESVAAKIPKADVENLIKALQKAVELGWTK